MHLQMEAQEPRMSEVTPEPRDRPQAGLEGAPPGGLSRLGGWVTWQAC